MPVRAALAELFELLEEYAPSWYSEAHHNRAVRALRQSAGRPSLTFESLQMSNSRSSARDEESVRSGMALQRTAPRAHKAG